MPGFATLSIYQCTAMALNLSSLSLGPRMPMMSTKSNKSSDSLRVPSPPRSPKSSASASKSPLRSPFGRKKKQKKRQEREQQREMAENEPQLALERREQPPRIPTPAATTTPDSSQLSLCNVPDRHRLLVSGDFSDCTVISCGHTFKLHKAVICYQSTFFMKALTSRMKEGITSTVILSEETELDDISRMIKFMYENDYRCHVRPAATSFDDFRPPSRTSLIQLVLDELWLDIRMYSLGNRYMIPDLMEHALQSFLNSVDNDVLFPVLVQRLSPHSTLRFVANDPDTVPSLIDLARRMYVQGDDLHERHKRAIFELMYGLYPCLCRFDEFRAALKNELSELAADILAKVTVQRTERMVERCANSMCEKVLVQEAAMELVSFCHCCQRDRRMDDWRIECMERLPEAWPSFNQMMMV